VNLCAFLWLKNRKAGLDRPLKVGGGIQPRLVTVLTPATTFTVGEDCNQNSRAVNRTSALIYNFYEKSLRRGVEKETCRETGFRALTK
jgi:hypothetical protein